MDEVLFPLSYLLKPERIEKNVRTYIVSVASARLANTPTDLKKQFLQVLYRDCQVPITVTDDALSVLFDHDAVFDFFIQPTPGVLESLSVEIIDTPYDESERSIVCENIQNALKHIQLFWPELFQSLYYFLSRIYVFPSKTLLSWSRSYKCMGVMFICPSDVNDLNFFTESIVHEALHQLIFLEQALHRIFPPEVYDAKDTWQATWTGAMTLLPRPLPIAWDSLIISATTQYLHLLSGDMKLADHLSVNFMVALEKFNAFIFSSESRNTPILTSNGYFWLQALNSTHWEEIRHNTFLHSQYPGIDIQPDLQAT